MFAGMSAAAIAGVVAGVVGACAGIVGLGVAIHQGVEMSGRMNKQEKVAAESALQQEIKARKDTAMAIARSADGISEDKKKSFKLRHANIGTTELRHGPQPGPDPEQTHFMGEPAQGRA